MIEMTINRIYEFSSAHRLHSLELSKKENIEIYDKCNNLNGHGHDYRLEVSLRGTPDEKTGMIIPLEDFDTGVDSVLRELDYKHLDNEVDYFSKNQDLTLHICGPIAKEKDFVKVYKKELFQTRNILNHDFINIEEKKFSEILELCSFVILPSCSEGGAPSVLTAIGNGGLIPIITKETAISTGYEIIINTLDEAGIENAVNRAISLNKSEVVNLSKKNLNFVLQHHSQDNYKNNLRLAIENILEEGVACEM